jgi:hypothetical protein
MNTALEQLETLKQSMQKMKQTLMTRKADDILEHSRELEQMVQVFRGSMLQISGSDESDRKQARLIVNDIRRTCRTNATIASTFSMLLKSTLSPFTKTPATKSTYAKDAGRDTPASPLLVFQKG